MVFIFNETFFQQTYFANEIAIFVTKRFQKNIF